MKHLLKPAAVFIKQVDNNHGNKLNRKKFPNFHRMCSTILSHTWTRYTCSHPTLDMKLISQDARLFPWVADLQTILNMLGLSVSTNRLERLEAWDLRWNWASEDTFRYNAQAPFLNCGLIVCHFILLYKWAWNGERYAVKTKTKGTAQPGHQRRKNAMATPTITQTTVRATPMHQGRGE